MPFLQALHYHPGRRRGPPRLVVVHMSESNGSAAALARYGATMSDGRIASWHYSVDPFEVWGCVNEADEALHAPPLNPESIGIEMRGIVAETSAAYWERDDNRNMLALTARLTGEIMVRHDIPCRFLDAAALAPLLPSVGAVSFDLARWGWTTHAEITRAFRKSTHLDPGPYFPVESFGQAVHAFIDGGVCR